MHESMRVHTKWAKCNLGRVTIHVLFTGFLLHLPLLPSKVLFACAIYPGIFSNVSLKKPSYRTRILKFIMHILLYILLFVFSAACTNAQGAWYYPDPNTVPIFNNVDVVNASWSVPATSSESAFLWLWCTPNGTVSYTLGEKAERYPCEQAG